MLGQGTTVVWAMYLSEAIYINETRRDLLGPADAEFVKEYLQQANFYVDNTGKDYLVLFIMGVVLRVIAIE